MFDNDLMTYWHGKTRVVTNRVIVSFVTPMTFVKLIFYARHDNIQKQERYQNVCLYLNNIESICTSDDRTTLSGDKIVLKNGLTKNIETVELNIGKITGVVAELEIYYMLTEGTK